MITQKYHRSKNDIKVMGSSQKLNSQLETSIIEVASSKTLGSNRSRVHHELNKIS